MKSLKWSDFFNVVDQRVVVERNVLIVFFQRAPQAVYTEYIITV